MSLFTDIFELLTIETYAVMAMIRARSSPITLTSLIADIFELLPVELHAVIAMSDPAVFGVLSRVSHEWNSKLAPLAKSYRMSLIVCKIEDGTTTHALLGKFHREDGPAVIRPDGTLEYWQYGKLHREGGPAVTYSDGTEEYWWHGIPWY